MSWLAALVDAIDRHGTVVRVTVVRADGSTPREVGAAMVVSAGDVRGTIGGGALELAAIAHARMMVRGGDGVRPLAHSGMGNHEGRGEGSDPVWTRDIRDFPLGPSLGQCCGGYAKLLFEVLGTLERAYLMARAEGCNVDRALLLRPLHIGASPHVTADRKEHRPEWPLGVTRTVREMLSGARPRVPTLVRGAKGGPAWFIEPLARPAHRLYVYGAGHVGRAIVRVLEELPFVVTWVDTAASRFPEHLPPYVRAEIAQDPAAFAGGTEADAFHLVLTYSHALDLAICHVLLRRGDFRFLGLIGSATKRARFLKRLAELGIADARLVRLICPIGLPGIGGKEPAMIAVSVAAQLVQLAAAADAVATGRSSKQEDATQ